MVDAGPLDGHEHISKAVRFHRAADLGDRRVKALLVVFDHGGWDEDASVEIGEHPLGTSLGTIHGHDTEVLGADLLNPRVERAGRFDNGQIALRATRSRLELGSHANTSDERDWESPNCRRVVRMAQREDSHGGNWSDWVSKAMYG